MVGMTDQHREKREDDRGGEEIRNHEKIMRE